MKSERITFELPRQDWWTYRLIQLGMVLFVLGVAIAFALGDRLGSAVATLVVGGWLVWKHGLFGDERAARQEGVAVRVVLSDEQIDAHELGGGHISLRWEEVGEIRELTLSSTRGLLVFSRDRDRRIAISAAIPGFDKLVHEIRRRAPQGTGEGPPPVSVPADVQGIIDATPADQVPLIPYREDTVRFMERAITEADCQRGWMEGTVDDRAVQISLPPWENVLRKFGQELRRKMDG